MNFGKAIFFFLFCLSFINSFNVYIDSSYPKSDSDGTLNKPFQNISASNDFISNNTIGNLFINNSLIIDSQLCIKNADMAIKSL